MVRAMGNGYWAKPGSPHYRPPSGVPAGGQLWGDKSAKPARAFGAANQPPNLHKSIGKMEAKEYREQLRARLGMTIAAYDEALTGENLALKLTAAKQIEDRVFGQAKQVVETQEDSRTDDEIAADIERRKRELGG